MPRNSNYDKYPFVPVSSSRADCWVGWREIGARLASYATPSRCVLCVECYPGAFESEIQKALAESLRPVEIISTAQLLKPASEVDGMLCEVLGDDPVFGLMNEISLEEVFDPARLDAGRKKAGNWQSGLLLIVGTGAALVSPSPDVLVYADMARWEIQARQDRKSV